MQNVLPGSDERGQPEAPKPALTPPSPADGCFMVPTRDDPDTVSRGRRHLRLRRSSPFAAQIHAAFAAYALFWNRGLFPRVEQRLCSTPARRKQATLPEERLLAVCLMQCGRNYEVPHRSHCRMSSAAESRSAPCTWPARVCACMLLFQSQIAPVGLRSPSSNAHHVRRALPVPIPSSAACRAPLGQHAPLSGP